MLYCLLYVYMHYTYYFCIIVPSIHVLGCIGTGWQWFPTTILFLSGWKIQPGCACLQPRRLCHCVMLCCSGLRMGTPKQRNGLTPRAMPPDRNALETLIAADDAGDCKGIEVNILKRAKMCWFLYFIDIIDIVDIMRIIPIILCCYLGTMSYHAHFGWRRRTARGIWCPWLQADQAWECRKIGQLPYTFLSDRQIREVSVCVSCFSIW